MNAVVIAVIWLNTLNTGAYNLPWSLGSCFTIPAHSPLQRLTYDMELVG